MNDFKFQGKQIKDMTSISDLVEYMEDFSSTLALSNDSVDSQYLIEFAEKYHKLKLIES